MRSKIVVIGLLFAGSVVGSATLTALRPPDALAGGGLKKKRAQTKQARVQEYLEEAGTGLPVYAEEDLTVYAQSPEGDGPGTASAGCKKKRVKVCNEKGTKTGLLEGGSGGEGALLRLGNGQKNVDKRATAT